MLAPAVGVAAEGEEKIAAASSVADTPFVLASARGEAAARGGGDEQLLPLTRTAAPFGVVVLITGRDIHIIRRDGSQLRLAGLPPGAPGSRASAPRAQSSGAPGLRVRPPVIHDGEAWVRPREVAVLLALPQPHQDLGTGASQRQSDPLASAGAPAASSPFETFEVRKPTVSGPAPLPSPVSRQLNLGRLELAAKERNWVEVSPVAVSLALSRVASLSGPAARGLCQEELGPAARSRQGLPRRLDPNSPFSPILSYLNMELNDDHRQYALGDVFDPLFGTATAIGFSTAVSANTRAGASVLLPLARPGEHPDGKFTVRAQTLAAKDVTAEAALASDGSYYTATRWERPDLSLRSSLSVLAGTQQRRDLWGQFRLHPALTLLGRAAGADGLYQAQASMVGLRWEMGRAQASLERARGVSSGQSWASDSASVFLFRRDLTGILRYVAKREGTGRSGLEWALSRTGSSGGQVFLSSSAPAYGEVISNRVYRLGTYWPVRKGLRAQAALAWEASSGGTERSQGSRLHPECKLEWRPSPDQVLSLRYGTFDPGLPGTVPGTAFVLQAALSLGGPGRATLGTGRIWGEVKDDAGQAVADIAVVLDDRETTLSRADGRYEFLAAGEGRHRVSLDPNRIPADLGAKLQPRTVFVSPQEAGRADFAVTRLCQISGQVYVEAGPDPSAPGQRQPVAGAAVELNTGARTTADDQGRYLFASLEPGSYRVSAVQPIQEPRLTPLPPSSWTFRLQPGDRATGADFGFRRHERPVILGRLDPA